jgi:mitochondrial GTPase 1
MFTDLRKSKDVASLIHRIKDIAIVSGRQKGLRTIVIGMPNTGKSSLLNALRRLGTGKKGPITLI